MIIIQLPEIDDLEEFEFVVKGQRRITISINEKNLSVQIPGGVNPNSISNSDASFFLRTKDIPDKIL